MTKSGTLVEPKISSTDHDQSQISADLGEIKNDSNFTSNFTSLSGSENKKDESESLLRESIGD